VFTSGKVICGEECLDRHLLAKRQKTGDNE
jgi:hypothetical protein